MGMSLPTPRPLPFYVAHYVAHYDPTLRVAARVQGEALEQ